MFGGILSKSQCNCGSKDTEIFVNRESRISDVSKYLLIIIIGTRWGEMEDAERGVEISVVPFFIHWNDGPLVEPLRHFASKRLHLIIHQHRNSLWVCLVFAFFSNACPRVTSSEILMMLPLTLDDRHWVVLLLNIIFALKNEWRMALNSGLCWARFVTIVYSFAVEERKSCRKSGTLKVWLTQEVEAAVERTSVKS